jgi:hypothetical protein
MVRFYKRKALIETLRRKLRGIRFRKGLFYCLARLPHRRASENALAGIQFVM